MKKTIYILIALLLISSAAAYRPVWDIYHSKADVISQMRQMCEASDRCESEVIGKTIKGNSIYMYKIGSPSAEKRILMDGSMHGWEDSGTEIMLELTRRLLRDPTTEYKEMLQDTYFLLVPIVNVDTVDRNNARLYNPDGTKISCGVDINRNFATGWGTTGSSDYLHCWPIVYRGYSAASEPETKAVTDALSRYKPHIYINWHMGGAKMWGGCARDEYSDRLKELMPGVQMDGCQGGFAVTQALSSGAKISLYTETVESDKIPDTAVSFLDLYYDGSMAAVKSALQALDEKEQVCSIERMEELEAEVARLTRLLDSIRSIIG